MSLLFSSLFHHLNVTSRCFWTLIWYVSVFKLFLFQYKICILWDKRSLHINLFLLISFDWTSFWLTQMFSRSTSTQTIKSVSYWAWIINLRLRWSSNFCYCSGSDSNLFISLISSRSSWFEIMRWKWSLLSQNFQFAFLWWNTICFWS